MTAPAIPLPLQIDAVRFAETRQRAMLDGKAIKELRGEQFGRRDLERLNAAARSLETLHRNADEIRAFLKLPTELRLAALEWAQAQLAAAPGEVVP